MTTPIVLLLLLAVSFAVSRVIRRYAERVVVLSGVEYVLVGVLLGPQLPPYLLTADTMEVVQPLLALLVGLLGFLVGLRSGQETMSGPSWAVGTLSAVCVLAAVCGAFVWAAELLAVPVPENSEWIVVELYRAWEHRLVLSFAESNLALGLSVGSAACVASASLIETTRGQLGVRGPQGGVLLALAETSQWVGITGLGMSLALARSSTAGLGVGLTEWALIALSLGGICGVLFSLFIGRETDPHRVFLAAIGAVTFASGIGSALGVSPLFVNLVAGWTVARTSGHAQAVRREMQRLSHPLFVMTMLLAGAMWEPVSGLWWLLPVGYLVVRFLARFIFVQAFGQALLEVRGRLYNGLWSQGTLAAAIAVSVVQRFPERASIVLSTVLMGSLVSELFSHRLLRAVLVDAGENATEVAEPTAAAEPAPGPVFPRGSQLGKETP